jgi:spermidine synthase
MDLSNNKKLLNNCYKNNNVTPDKFWGDVLVLGLGCGVIIDQIITDSIDIVEIDKKVIDKYNNKNNKNIILSDAYEYKTDKLYDIIFIDIWYYKAESEKLNILKDKYFKNLKEGGKFIWLPLIFK